MYSLLHEEDLWSGLWQKHAHYNETIIAISYEQQGFFEQAQGTYEVKYVSYNCIIILKFHKYLYQQKTII